MITGLIALTLAALFTGAALYINVAEQPARLRLRPGPLLAQWQDSYARAVTLQSSLALAGGVLGIVYWWREGVGLALAGALLLLANWPYTLTVIRPLNAKLNALSPLAAPEHAHELIEHWGRLHGVRTLLGAAATAAFIAAIMRSAHF